MNLTIDKDKVLAAADTCPQARNVLETLFPEVFEETTFLASRGSFNKSVMAIDNKTKSWAIAFERGNEHGSRFQLSPIFDWEIIKEGNFHYLKPKSKNG